MTPVTRSPICIFRLAVYVAALAVLTGVSVAPKAVALAEGRAVVASHLYYPEVRLRKLHLVRPDLIPYPIFYDIYC